MELYKDISEFPTYNWFKCIDTKDYKYCLIKPIECNQEQVNECQEAFERYYCEYLDTFGVSEQLQDIIRLQNDILSLKIDMVLTEDKSMQFNIDMVQLQLNDKLNVKQSKTNTAKIAIEKYLGFRINEKEVSVKEYYDYLEAIKQNG